MFREWQCTLSVLVDGTVVQVTGLISLSRLGDARITATFSGRHSLASFARQDITGTHGAFSVNAQDAVAVNASFSSTTGQTIATFVATEIVIERPTLGVSSQKAFFKALRVLGPCAFSSGSTNYSLVQLPLDPNDTQVGEISACLESDSPGSFRDAQLLLGLAQRCKARAPLRERYDSVGLCGSTLLADDAMVQVGHPLIPPRGADLASFMNSALAAYPAVYKDLELPRLLEYYCLSVESTFSEFKFILASVFMEGLKFYWAKNVGAYKPIVKPSGLISGFEKKVNGKGKPVPYTFSELIVATYAHYKLNPAFTFIEDRNALFHTGAAGAVQLGATSPWPILRPELEKLYKQIDDFLLTLLAYGGLVRRWQTPDQDDAFP